MQCWRRHIHVQVQVEPYCHSATYGYIQWNEMLCLTGPRCYINTGMQQLIKKNTINPYTTNLLTDFDYNYTIYKCYLIRRLKNTNISASSLRDGWGSNEWAPASSDYSTPALWRASWPASSPPGLETAPLATAKLCKASCELLATLLEVSFPPSRTSTPGGV